MAIYMTKIHVFLTASTVVDFCCSAGADRGELATHEAAPVVENGNPPMVTTGGTSSQGAQHV